MTSQLPNDANTMLIDRLMAIPPESWAVSLDEDRYSTNITDKMRVEVYRSGDSVGLSIYRLGLPAV